MIIRDDDPRLRPHAVLRIKYGDPNPPQWRKVVPKPYKIQPLADRVVLRPIETEEKTPGGIVIPEKSREKKARGVLLAVGPGKRRDDGTSATLDVAVGDEVFYSKYGGTEIEVDGEKVRIISEAELLARIV